MAWYELNLQPDGDTWLVTAPAFPELATYGEDKEAACRNGREAVLQAIAGRIADNEEVPVPVMELPDDAARSGFVQLPVPSPSQGRALHEPSLPKEDQGRPDARARPSG